MTLPTVRHDLTSLPARDRGQQDDSHNDWTYETGSAQVDEERQRAGEDVPSAMQRVSDILGLVEGAHTRYLAATPDERKQMNNALLSRVLIGPDDEDLLVEMRAEVSEILAG